jgi:hypothetical protein
MVKYIKFHEIDCVDDYRAEVFKFTDCLNLSDAIKCPNGKCLNVTNLDGSEAFCNMTSNLT